MKLYTTLIAVALGLAACEPATPIAVNPADWAPKPHPDSIAVKAADWSSKPPTAADAVRKNLALIFDASGSMEGQKLTEAKRAVSRYLGSLDASVKMTLIVFGSEGLRTVSELGADPAKILADVERIRASGGTPLGGAVGLAYEALAARAREATAGEQYHMAIVTDGEAQDIELLRQNIDAVLGTPVQVCTIGFGLGDDHALKRPGTRYIPAADEAALGRGLGQILAEREEP